MTLKVTDHVKGTSCFSFCTGGHLYYKTDDTGFVFPIPFEDTAGATFQWCDKSIFFMRWIRKQVETLNKGGE